METTKIGEILGEIWGRNSPHICCATHCKIDARNWQKFCYCHFIWELPSNLGRGRNLTNWDSDLKSSDETEAPD